MNDMTTTTTATVSYRDLVDDILWRLTCSMSINPSVEQSILNVVRSGNGMPSTMKRVRLHQLGLTENETDSLLSASAPQ